MFVLDLIMALVIAILLTAIFAFGLRRPGQWTGTLWFFLVVFLGAWAAAIWIGPLGPPLLGLYWVPALLVGLILALLLAALSPREPRRGERERIELDRSGAPPQALRVFNFFFLVLIVLLAVIILFGYMFLF